jgi:hypothetical protein
MKKLIVISACLLMPWFAHDAWANCYIMNLGDGDKIHNCDYGWDSGLEMSYGSEYEDGLIFRYDGLIDDVLGLGEGFAYILRNDGRINDVIGIGYGDGVIFHDGTWIDDDMDIGYGDTLSLR